MTTTIRISQEARSLLRELANDEQSSMQGVLERALEQYRRRRFLERVNQAYTLITDPAIAAAVAEEAGMWDRVVSDGLPTHEAWAEDGSVVKKRRKGRRK
jgi:hypothetical protein